CARDHPYCTDSGCYGFDFW
nr:immunoglobulin heavy chain junction region [Macaca mulatta]